MHLALDKISLEIKSSAPAEKGNFKAIHRIIYVMDIKIPIGEHKEYFKRNSQKSQPDHVIQNKYLFIDDFSKISNHLFLKCWQGKLHRKKNFITDKWKIYKDLTKLL